MNSRFFYILIISTICIINFGCSKDDDTEIIPDIPHPDGELLVDYDLILDKWWHDTEGWAAHTNLKSDNTYKYYYFGMVPRPHNTNPTGIWEWEDKAAGIYSTRKYAYPQMELGGKYYYKIFEVREHSYKCQLSSQSPEGPWGVEGYIKLYPDNYILYRDYDE